MEVNTNRDEDEGKREVKWHAVSKTRFPFFLQERPFYWRREKDAISETE